MDDFETFKSSREKMDPTSRKMSDQQWTQAYAAYRSARKRVGGSAGADGDETDEGSSKKKRRRSKKASSGRGGYHPGTTSGAGHLRARVRAQSAYGDLRLIVDLLAWVAIAVAVLAAVLTLFVYTSAYAGLASLLGAVLQVIAIVTARLLVHVVIDIPDIALYRAVGESVAPADDAGDRET